MKILINSNYDFFEKSLSVLLPSITDKTCSLEIIIGGSPWEYKKEVRDGINYHFVNYDNIDYTSFIFVSEHPEIVKDENLFLYIHDTTKTGPLFFEKFNECLTTITSKYQSIEEFNEKTSNIRLILDYTISMNMGLYRSDFFTETKIIEFLSSIKNTDLSYEGKMKSKVLGFRYEDYFLRDCEALTNETRVTTEIENPYGTDIKRIQEYYPGLDFYKYKSNWNYLSRVINL
jgi:hypothetical protein